MTLHDVARLNTYWTSNPPLTVLVRAIAQAFGVEIKPAEEKHYMTAEEAARHLALTDGRIPGVGSV